MTDADADRHPRDDPERLRELHHEEGLSTAEIGRRFGVTGQTVRFWMRKHSISRRHPNGTPPDTAGGPPYDRAYRDPDYLRTAYWARGQSLAEISGVLNIASSTVEYWMIEHSIPRRDSPDPPLAKDYSTRDKKGNL